MTATNGAGAAGAASASDNLRPLSGDGWELLHGDCRALMATIDDSSSDSIVTDPPYELGFMGKDWDRSRVAYDVATWAEALRVLKPGGWLVAFSGSRTYHRMACAIEDAGFEIRDQIMWIYGSGFPKGGVRDGKGTCLKPAHEPIVLARKPLIGSVAANEAAFGTGALNIDACRIGEREKPKVTDPKHAGHRHNSYGAPSGGGRLLPPGRWPANVVHDGSDEVLAAFPAAPGQIADAELTGERKTGRVYGEMGYPRSGEASAGSANDGAVGFNMKPGARRLDSGTAARFFYCAKASKADRDEGLDQFEPQAFVQFQTGNGESGQASSLSAGRETQYRNTHPTVKPTALMRWLVRLVTPPAGLVLDPFTGSGSTGRATLLEGRRFIGCELTDQYLPIAAARIANAAAIAAAPPVAADPDQFPLPLSEGAVAA